MISGNSNTGVEINAPGNTVQGDWIGVDSSGNAPLGNNGPGLVIQAGNETIGGPSASPGAAPGNVISANLDIGIFIYNAGAGVGTIQGNIVGLGADGSTPLGNGGNDGGIYVALASLDLTIGGPVAADRNVISANSGFGIITDSGATGLAIEGNYVGTDATGTLDRGNTQFGIYVNAPGALIGGLTSTPGTAPGNVVSGNGTAVGNGTGIAVVGDGGTVEGNIIGLDRTGTTVLPGNVQGDGVVNQYGSNTTIGGIALGARNLISGNSYAGVILAAPGGNHTVAGQPDRHRHHRDLDCSREPVRRRNRHLVRKHHRRHECRCAQHHLGNNADQCRRHPVSPGGHDWQRGRRQLDRHQSAGNVALANETGVEIDCRGDEQHNRRPDVDARHGRRQSHLGATPTTGVVITNLVATGNVVAGNLVGTDPTGSVCARHRRRTAFMSTARTPRSAAR